MAPVLPDLDLTSRSAGLPELLAPAGDPVMLHAAVRAGADAVYLGMQGFNARRNAGNFNEESLAAAVAYCHLRGVKVYVTMNTLVMPGEMKDALKCARTCADIGVDAFIVQDLGLFAKLREDYSAVELHVSTQMNIHSIDGVDACAALGATRITLARELSLGEIEHLSAHAHELGLGIEVFAHGAICVCYSGQCLMSSLIGGRSANRGLCAQACRLPYKLKDPDAPDREIRTPGEHLLSPKDLCTVADVEALAEAGVDSLKIEGRMKSPEYVFATISVYREALDRLQADRAAAEDDCFEHAAVRKLQSVFSRGFTSGYLHGDRSNELMAYSRPNNRGESIGRVKSVTDSVLSFNCDRSLVVGDVLEVWTSRGNVVVPVGEDLSQGKRGVHIPLPEDARGIHQGDRIFRVRSAEAAYVDDDKEPRIPITGSAVLNIGQPLRVEFQTVDPVRDGGVVSVQMEGPIVEAARTKAVSAEDVEAHIDRLGQTPFVLTRFEVELDEGVGIGFSQLHHVRADALEELERAIIAAFDAERAEGSEEHGGESGERASCAGLRASKSEGAIIPPISLPAESRCEADSPDSNDICIAVQATNPECARAAKRAGASLIYVSAVNYKRGQSETEGRFNKEVSQGGFPKHSIPMMPVVSHDPVGGSREELIGQDVWEYAAAGEPVFVESLGALWHAIALGAIPEVGPRLPLANKEALSLAGALEIPLVWLTPELNFAQIRDLVKRAPSAMGFGLKVSGAQELMITEHCMLMSQGDCNEDCPTCPRRRAPHILEDRKGYGFPVTTDMFGRSHLYNSVELDAIPEVAQLLDEGVTAFMVDATLMSPERTAQATGRLRKAIELALADGSSLPKEPRTTSGHLHRGVK